MNKMVLVLVLGMFAFAEELNAKNIEIVFRSAPLLRRVREKDELDVTIWDKDGKKISTTRINARVEGDKSVTFEAPKSLVQADLTLQVKDVSTGENSPFYAVSVPYLKATGLFFRTIIGVRRPGLGGKPRLYDISACENCFRTKIIQKP